MSIPIYPNFSPINLSMKSELHPRLSEIPDGISEFCFAGLYLFRNSYNYKLSFSDSLEKKLIIHGERDGKSFYAFPFGLPENDTIKAALLKDVDYFKGISERFITSLEPWSLSQGNQIFEDRDNFDYIYRKDDLAKLEGKKYHKKRNHVNAFINNYEYSEKQFCSESIKDAYTVLDIWREERGRDDDYFQSKEALDLTQELELCGYMVWANNRPAAFTLGETIQNGKTFVVHIEKGIQEFRGVYQFINMAFAGVLPDHVEFINREQDLGNPGLRQSKMTYLPSGFIKKFRIYPVSAELPQSFEQMLVSTANIE